MPRDLLVFTVGFATTSIGSIFVVDRLGAVLLGRYRGELAVTAVIFLFVVALAVADLRLQGQRDICSVGFRRQTPRHLGFTNALGVLLWGFDTGVPFTTIRATPLPFVGMLFVFVGWGGPWAGAAYSIGFLGMLWVLCWVRRPHTRSSFPQATWVFDLLIETRAAGRVGGWALTVASAAALSVPLIHGYL